jgi:glutamate synthase (NADPH/NADH) small chain
LSKIKPSIPMPKQSPEERIHNFSEVALGYAKEQAITEAERCLQCPKPECIQGCPVGVDIPAFVAFIREGKFKEAVLKIKEKNSLPAICGRVCPQEKQCQKHCVLGKKGFPVSVGSLERFVADYELKKGVEIPTKPAPTGKKIAVIGSGPAGLTVAADLAKLGHEVVVFEALHAPGGVLRYGIPEFRLPKMILEAEVDYVKKLGVKINTNIIIGKLYTVYELLDAHGFHAVFTGTGAGLPSFLHIPGENLGGIYSANEFLIRVNLMKAYMFPDYDTPIKVGEKVTVIGGGDAAMDASRSALRLDANEVHIVYRRSRNEMPTRSEELKNAKDEGVKFTFLTNPVRFHGDEHGWVQKMECIRMQLGELDESDRRRPIQVKGSNFLTDVNTVVVAIGQTPNPIIQRTTPSLKVTKHSTIVVDNKMQTNIEGVYAGGDIISGTATVISAMGAGKAAAKSIHEYVMKTGKSLALA